MEFLKNVGSGLLALLAMVMVCGLVLFLGAVVLTFNDWLYYSHQPWWPIFWGAIGVGLLVTLLAGIGSKIRAIPTWE